MREAWKGFGRVHEGGKEVVEGQGMHAGNTGGANTGGEDIPH